jgi:hypothetical protein
MRAGARRVAREGSRDRVLLSVNAGMSKRVTVGHQLSRLPKLKKPRALRVRMVETFETSLSYEVYSGKGQWPGLQTTCWALSLSLPTTSSTALS